MLFPSPHPLPLLCLRRGCISVSLCAPIARAQQCAHAAGLLDNFALSDELLVKETFASFLLQCMHKRGDPHLKNFFETAIDPSGEPNFSGKDNGCFYFKPRGNDPSICGFLVHSLTDTEVPIGAGDQMKLPMSTVIADNWSDYHAYIIILGSKHYCFKIFSGTSLKLKKPGKKDFAEAAEEVLRKTRATKSLHTVELDSSLQSVAKRRRPVTPPKAAGVVAASVSAASSPPQAEPPTPPQAKASAPSACEGTGAQEFFGRRAARRGGPLSPPDLGASQLLGMSESQQSSARGLDRPRSIRVPHNSCAKFIARTVARLLWGLVRVISGTIPIAHAYMHCWRCCRCCGVSAGVGLPLSATHAVGE